MRPRTRRRLGQIRPLTSAAAATLLHARATIDAMTLKEKILFHQVHPAKLATDAISAVISLYFFWQHALTLGLHTSPIMTTALSMYHKMGFRLQRDAPAIYGVPSAVYLLRLEP